MIRMDDLLQSITTRKVVLGLTDTPERTEALRNKGGAADRGQKGSFEGY